MEQWADGHRGASRNNAADIAETEGYRNCFHPGDSPAVAELPQTREEESGQRDESEKAGCWSMAAREMSGQQEKRSAGHDVRSLSRNDPGAR